MDNDSPFANTNSLIVLYLEPYLNTFYKSYQNIITLNAMPTGPLALLVSSISSPRLSPFYDTSPFTSYPQCTFALLRYPNNSSTPHSPKNPDFFMGADDIPSVFSYLRQNGYTIDTSLTKLILNTNISLAGTSNHNASRKMICTIQYNH